MDEYTTWKDFTDDIIIVLQALISGGCAIRCFLILRAGRAEEIPLSKSLNQCKKYLAVIILSMTIVGVVVAINTYF